MQAHPMLLVQVLLATLFLSITAAQAANSGAQRSQVIERGEDFAVIGNITSHVDEFGNTVNATNRFTVLENAMHYFENGEWKESEDLIESFPDGAIARRGPHKAIFNHDLNSESVFDIETSDGKRLRGGVRAIQLTDSATGRSLVLATVRENAPGELLPPNQIVFRDGLIGSVRADVVLVWRHNFFAQDVVLTTRPSLPPEMAAESTRLEIVTEFINPPAPELRRQTRREKDGSEMVDDTVIHFGRLAMIVGKAFPVNEGYSLGNWNPAADGTPILKQWHQLEDGRTFLVESIAWNDLLPHIQNLQLAQTDLPNESEAASSRIWPKRILAAQKSEPLQVASAAYEAKGYVWDFTIIPDQGTPLTFATGQTYYIKTSYYTGSTVTFQPGCTIKYKNNAYLLFYGSVSFPDTLQTPVFTSRNDDGFGEKIKDVYGELDSDGNASSHRAAQAIWVYFVDAATTIRNARIRWAQTGIHYDQNSGVSASHTLQRCLFEEIQGYGNEAIYVNIPDGALGIDNCQKWDVDTATDVSAGSVSGSLSASPFGTEMSFAGINGSPSDNNTLVADTMGAVGASEFMEVLNRKLAVYVRSTGVRTNEMLINDFFSVQGETRDMFDPRVWYDHANQRWVACAADKIQTNLVMKVSTSSSASLSTNNWLSYVITNLVSNTNQSVDFPTLGSDANGLYISVQIKSGSANLGFKIQAFKKPGVYSTNYSIPSLLDAPLSELDTWCIQPAFSYETNPLGNYAWFVAKGPSSGNNGGQIFFRRLQWTSTTPVLIDEVPGSSNAWVAIPDPTPGYTNYFDLPQAGTNSAPQSGGSMGLGSTGSRLMMAVIRDGHLWTCHHVGLDGTDGDFDGGTPDRSAVQWFKIQVTSGGLTNATYGRIYDSSASTPYWYYFPSLNVDGNGHTVFGFSGSKTGEHIGAFFTGRKSDGTWLARPTLVQAGRASWPHTRWGDYSATSIDPNDGSFWTVQEYSHPTALGYQWGTWIMQVKSSQ